MPTAPTRAMNRMITRFFDQAATAYDQRTLQHVMYRPPQDEVLAQLRRARSQQIADIGCGTGIFATRMQRELGPATVFGVDLSEGMLDQARARSTEVTWLHGPAEKLPFEDGQLDAVVSTTAFHFFDGPAAVAEFHRVLAPGGLLAIATMRPTLPLSQPIQRLTRNRLSPAHAPAPREMRKLFETGGFEVIDQHPIHRPVITRLALDVITVGRKP